MAYYLNHEDNRKKVCVLCGRKIVLNKQKIDYFSVKKYEDLVKKFGNKSFESFNSKFPLSLCTTCRVTLKEHEKNITKRPLPIMPNYEDIQLRKETRSSNSNDQFCYCYICLTARSQGHSKVIKGKGHIRKNITTIINESNGLYGSIDSNGTHLVSESIQCRENKSLKICENCFQELHKGKPHSCSRINSINVQVEASKNIVKIFEKLPNKQQLQIAHSVLKRQYETSKSSENKINEINLNTKGNTKKIMFGTCRNRNVAFSHESLDNFKVDTSSSTNHMRKLTNFIQSHTGRNTIPADYRTHASEKSKVLEDLYKIGEFDFDVEKSMLKQKRTVVYADAEELLESIVEKRQVIGHYQVKIMADGGQDFFKICMSILPQFVDEENGKLPFKKRKLYSDGGSVGQKAVETSVNRLIILCIVPNVKETYSNIELLFKLIKINNISFKFVSDFKILLIVNGQQTATSTCPCPYCFDTLDNLRNYQNDKYPVNDSIDVSDGLKTYGDIKKDFELFCSMGKNKKLAKLCHSTINLPLFHEDDSTCILEKCIIPELHILQGFVNHLFWSGIVRSIGREKAIMWPKKLKLISKNYHGDIFEGNACRKMLKFADTLLDSEIFNDTELLQLTPFVNAFRIMNKVVECCFSVRSVASDVGVHIKNLKKAIEATEVSQTLKLHVILKHTEQCLHYLKNKGLGIWSEQAGESIHREFLNYWKKYKINIMDDPTYSIRLKKAVVEFSSSHI